MLQRIKPKRVTEEIAQQIQDLISRGRLKAGDRLPAEREMAKQLGVSRPTLREALQVLEHSGFLETHHGNGTYVRDVGEQALKDPLSSLIRDSSGMIVDLAEFRTEVEAWAAGQAAGLIQPEELDVLKSIVDRMQECIEAGKPVHDLDAEFHLALASATQNSIYIHVANTIFYLFAEVTRLSHEQIFVSREDQKKLFDEHRSIYEAVARKDAKTARRLMHHHLKNTEDWFKQKGVTWRK